MSFRPVFRTAALAALTASFAGATAAEGQSGHGFLFDEPRVSLGARGGFGVASADSDLFEFTTSELTLGRSDFIGFSAAGDAGVLLLPRVELLASGGYTGSRSGSESRGFVGEDNLPIRQTTEFQRVPLTAGLRLYPLPRGRTIGSYAWLPARVVPYVGGAAGLMWYRFRQSGEFVDAESLDIFNEVLESSGWTPTAEAFGGVALSLGPRWSVTGEGRYTWASAELSNSFEGFDPIDLAGFAVTLGVSVRY